MASTSQVTKKLNSLLEPINAGKSFKDGTFIEYGFNDDSSISVFSTQYYYGGDGYLVGRGAWFNKNKKELYRGKPRKVKGVIAFLVGLQLLN